VLGNANRSIGDLTNSENCGRLCEHIKNSFLNMSTDQESIGYFDSVVDQSMPFSQWFISINSNGGSIGNIRWTNKIYESNGTFYLTKTWKTLQKLSEQHLRNFSTPWPKTINELSDLVRSLVNCRHSYGTAVYAMSIASQATFNFISHVEGVTGFMASCADLDFIRRTRHIKGAFTVVTANDYLYPQYEYRHEEHRKTLEESAARIALDKIKNDEDLQCHPDVYNHWHKLAETYFYDEYIQFLQQAK
jgi:hypothetical protein